jgi:phage FluMu protein Com
MVPNPEVDAIEETLAALPPPPAAIVVEEQVDDVLPKPETPPVNMGEMIRESLDPNTDLTDIIGIVVGDFKEGDQILAEMLKTYKNPEELLEAISKENTFLKTFYGIMLSEGGIRAQMKLICEFLQQLKEQGKTLTDSVEYLSDKVQTGRTMTANPDGSPVILTGEEARIATIARTRGFRRVVLPNSGFHITLRPMGLSELLEFARSVDTEEKELGKILGGHFHVIADVFIKQKFMSLLPRVVIGSNLTGYATGKTLVENIAFQDYDTILHAMCTAMYRSGIAINITCPKCKISYSGHKIDLNKVKHHVLDGIPREAVEFLYNTKQQVTPAQLAEYREKLLGQEYMIKNCCGMNFVLQVPTMEHWLTCSVKMMAKMTAVIQGKPQFDDDATALEFTVNIAKMMAPWIRRIEHLDGSLKPISVTSDPEAILEALEAAQINPDPNEADIYTRIQDFIQMTKLTYICYTMVQCPKCKAVPSVNVGDYTPVDVQDLFFNLACHTYSVTGKKSKPTSTASINIETL